MSRCLAILIALFLIPVGVNAQQEGGLQLPPEAAELIVEMEEIQERLHQTQEQALADPALRASQVALSGEIQSAMVTLDPEMPRRMERFSELESEMAAAREQQDEQRMRAIITEAEQIQERLGEVEAEALRRPEIAEQMESFQSQLLARMTEIDPQTERLVDRASELDTRLRALLSPGD